MMTRMRRCHRQASWAWVATLMLLFLFSCASTSPEQEAAEAAKTYYERLANGYAEGFLEGKANVDRLPTAYCEQLLTSVKQYQQDMQLKHGGLHEVRISPNVGKTDSTLHLTYAFLMLCFGDSTQEEVVVPMVQADGEWWMK